MKNKINILFRVILLTLAGSFIYAMHSGIRNNYGIMINTIVDNSGLSFTSVSFILAVGQLIFGLVQPMFGIIAAKRGNVFAFVSGVVLTVAGLIITPLCKTDLSLMLCLGVILPAGHGAISYGLIVGTITPKIPAQSVSVVAGIINASSGIGNTVLSPVINSLIKNGGLMYGMLILTVPITLTLPISFLIRGKGRPRAADNTSATITQLLPLRAEVSVKNLFGAAMTNGAYIFLMIGFFTCGFHMALITNHLPTQIQSFGFSSEAAAYAFSIYGVTTIIGSVLSGCLCDKFKMKNVLGFYYGLRPITILFFLLLSKTLFNVTFFTALFGFSGAATVPPVFGIINRTFGAASIATLFGLVFFVHQIGGFFGAWFGGICFDITKSYNVIWNIDIILSVVASAVSFAIREDNVECTTEKEVLEFA